MPGLVSWILIPPAFVLTLVGWVECELALRSVDDHATDKVADIDENFSNEESLPEIVTTYGQRQQGTDRMIHTVSAFRPSTR